MYVLSNVIFKFLMYYFGKYLYCHWKNQRLFFLTTTKWFTSLFPQVIKTVEYMIKELAGSLYEMSYNIKNTK